ncbi:MAG: hypothetical protein SFW08_01180 [Gemmatimonadaceae bacterium]|nr:hypothetical protein [Gemmatimonadaceae bacterium]
MNLYLALLRVQFGLTRPVWFGAVIAVIAAYATPHLTPSTFGAWREGGGDAGRLLSLSAVGGGILIVTALTMAFAAAASWAEEGSRNRGVYLMALPLERWHLAALEYAVAVTLILGVGLAMLIIGGAYAMFVSLPPGLHAYPVAIAVRTTGASLLVLSLMFPLSRLNVGAQQVTARTTVMLLVALAGLGLWVLLESMGVVSIARPVFRWAFSSGGPLHLWVGSWMLVDI